MSVIQAVILGVLQGLTEFLPVSSSGHLVLARAMMELKEIPVLFDIVLHMATLIVVIWVFRQKIGALLKSLYRVIRRNADRRDWTQFRLLMQLAAATALTAVLGFAVSALPGRENPRQVSALLILTGLILAGTARSKGTRSLGAAGWGRSLALGAAQGLGVFPGISRSGITIGTGLLCGMERKAAGEFSFLLSIPAIGGAFLLTLKDAAELSASVPLTSLCAAFLAALLTGYLALKLLLWLITGGKLWLFALYLIPVGVWGLFRF